MAKQRKSNCNSMKNKRNQKQGGCGCGIRIRWICLQPALLVASHLVFTPPVVLLRFLLMGLKLCILSMVN